MSTTEQTARERLRAALANKVNIEEQLGKLDTEENELRGQIRKSEERIEEAEKRLRAANALQRRQAAAALQSEREKLGDLEAYREELRDRRWSSKRGHGLPLGEALRVAHADVRAAAGRVLTSHPSVLGMFEEHANLRQRLWSIEASLWALVQGCAPPAGYENWFTQPVRQFDGAQPDPRFAAFVAELQKNADADLPEPINQTESANV